MEITSIITAILISLLSSGGLLINQIATNTIKSQTENVEELEVRISALPTHLLLKGQVNKVRIASRGLKPTEAVRLEALEIETDSIDIDLNQLKFNNLQDLRQSLGKPLQAGISLVLTETDLNKTLQSREIQSYVQKITGNNNDSPWEISNIRLNLLTNKRIKVETQIKILNRGEENILNVDLEAGIEIINGSKIKIIEPIGTLNGRQLSKKLLQGFADNINEQLDLTQLETFGITLRILKLDLNDHKISMAAFVHIKESNLN